MYPAAHKYSVFMDGMLTDDLAIRFGLGDWTTPARSIPTELLTSAYAREVHRALARFAKRFGFADDAAHHEKRASAILAAIQRRFCRPDGTFTRNEPASLAVVAVLKLVANPEKAAAKLDEIIRRQKGVMNCGMFGTKYIPRALAEYGYYETAVLCFTQESAPGWQWQKNEKGATTLWEYWNGRASHNHVIHGGDFPAWWVKYSKHLEK
jgi:alpha-L-rhamnosidase